MRSVLGRACLLIYVAGAAAGQTSLADASLEQLLNTRVTSVSKREENLGRSAAAVFVISAEDIRRSGATSLPDVLRMAPGVDVQQVDANIWAISIRGFNSRYSNKVLVMVDGRSVYTPTFAGVYWDNQELPLENIERIEVIRGPGATLWGVNGVNGVISILTKSAKDTQGRPDRRGRRFEHACAGHRPIRGHSRTDRGLQGLRPFPRGGQFRDARRRQRLRPVVWSSRWFPVGLGSFAARRADGGGRPVFQQGARDGPFGMDTFRFPGARGAAI